VLPDGSEDVGGPVDSAHDVSDLSDFLIRSVDQVSIHHGEQREHGDGHVLEYLALPEETHAQEGVANEDRQDAQHRPHHYRERPLKCLNYEVVLVGRLYVSKQAEPCQHAAQAESKVGESHI
jgi:hypothetical protein